MFSHLRWLYLLAAGQVVRVNRAIAKPTKSASTELSREAHKTLSLIKKDGPFPYHRDGATFGNFERRLPQKERGYYKEYTVPTPGARDRGARRIVAGRKGEFYFTDDHYQTFRRILE